MSVFHYYKPKEKKARTELENFICEKIDDNHYVEYKKLLDRFRQAIFNHGVAAEREEREGIEGCKVRNIVEYRLICAGKAIELESLVNSAIKDGWALFERTIINDESSGVWYHQAMVRYEGE